MRILLFLLLLCVSITCDAKGIVGRWECSKEVVAKVDMAYENVWCHYRFKRNGRLIIKINGETFLNHSSFDSHRRSGEIRIKGLYTVRDGKISSDVENEDVKTYASDAENRMFARRQDNSMRERTRSESRSTSSWCERQLRQKLLVYRFLWDWDNEPLVLTDDSLKIGNHLVCKR